jgi:hypothetical protein
MPALRAKSRSDKPARPSCLTSSQAASRIASRAERRRASRQSAASTNFIIGRYSCTALKSRQSDVAKREQRRQRSPSSSRLRICISGLRRANAMPGISPTGLVPISWPRRG